MGGRREVDGTYPHQPTSAPNNQSILEKYGLALSPALLQLRPPGICFM